MRRVKDLVPSSPGPSKNEAYRSRHDISWFHYTAGNVLQNMDAVDWPKVHRHLPLATMDEAAGRPNPVWREQFEHARLDEFWEPLRYQDKYDGVKVPVLHISGWYDDEQLGTPLNFFGMTTRGPTEVRGSQKLLMGPWPHAINSTTKLGEVELAPPRRSTSRPRRCASSTAG